MVVDLPTKILVPVDLSKRSEHPIEYAAQLADRIGSELVLVTNVDLAERRVLEEDARFEGLSAAEAATSALRTLGATHAPSVELSVIVRFHNSAANGILHALDDSGADAIVMGSHGRSGMSRWTLGSVAEKVVRSATVPVTILPIRDA